VGRGRGRRGAADVMRREAGGLRLPHTPRGRAMRAESASQPRELEGLVTTSLLSGAHSRCKGRLAPKPAG